MARAELMTDEAPNLQLLVTSGGGEAAVLCPLRANPALCLAAHSAPVRGVTLSGGRALSCAADGSLGEVDLGCVPPRPGECEAEGVLIKPCMLPDLRARFLAQLKTRICSRSLLLLEILGKRRTEENDDLFC